jgi:acyl-CoA thioesterase
VSSEQTGSVGAEHVHTAGVDAEALRARVDDALATSRPAFGEFFLARLLDLTITYDDDQQRTFVELPYADFLLNPQGSVHGGVIATVMDISMGHLCHRYLSTAVTIETQLRFFRPVHGASRCEGRLLRPGRRIVHLQSHLYDDVGRLAAAATGTWHRLDADRPTSSTSNRPGNT